MHACGCVQCINFTLILVISSLSINILLRGKSAALPRLMSHADVQSLALPMESYNAVAIDPAGSQYIDYMQTRSRMRIYDWLVSL